MAISEPIMQRSKEYEDGFAAGKQEGRREAVKWADSPCEEEHWYSFADGQMHRWPTRIRHKNCPRCWPIKLKEWGISSNASM